MGLLNLDVNSITKNALDPENAELIKSATVEGLHVSASSKEKPKTATKESGAPEIDIKPAENSPFAVTDDFDTSTIEIKEPAEEPIQEEPAQGEIKIEEPIQEEPAQGEIKIEEPIQEEPAQGEIKIEEPIQEEPAQGEIKIEEPIQEIALDNSTPATTEEGIKHQAPVKKSGAGKVIAIIISIVIILALAGGGYYFFILKNTPKPTPIEPEIITPEIVIPEIVIPEILQGNPKYLNLDLAEMATSEDAISKMGQYISEFKASGETKATEYVISDLNNNPIGLKAFSTRLGVTLPSNILSLVEDEMRFFINNDNGNPGIGIILTSKDDILLRAALAKLEPKLVEYAKILIPSVEIPAETLAFKKSTYKDTEKKYYNVTSPIELSIDYILSENQLYIGTTRLTSQTIYDLVEEEAVIAEEKAKLTTVMPDSTLEEDSTIQGIVNTIQEVDTATQEETPTTPVTNIPTAAPSL